MNTILALFFAINISTVRCGLRVIGGRDAEQNELPYVLRLERHISITVPDHVTIAYPIHVCTCSALTPTTTLTSAHCVAENASEYVIRYGILSENAFSRVLSRLRHPAYLINYTTKVRSDIALLKTEWITLKQYAKVSNLDPISLRGQQITLVGFGVTNSSKFKGTTLDLWKPLQVLDAIVIGCSSNPPEMVNLLMPRMCVARRCGESSSLCPGDSGGPALHSSGIVALNSLAIHGDCYATITEDRDRSHLVGMLTPVSPFVDWISSHVKEDE